MTVYKGNFDSWEDVVNQFCAGWCDGGKERRIALEAHPEPQEVVYANYDTGGCWDDGTALVI